MSRFDKILTFEHDETPYFLFRALNFGTQTDELKFIFLAQDPRFSRAAISMKKPQEMHREDVVSDYGELTYHSDGSLLFKYPTYEIESMRYHNPKEQGYRRTKLSRIEGWEPVAVYNIFSYRGHEVSREYIIQKSAKLFELKNRSIFNGNPIRCYINLVNKDFATPGLNASAVCDVRLPGITTNLDLWLFAMNIHKRGFYLNVEGSDTPIFSSNSWVQIPEKKSTLNQQDPDAIPTTNHYKPS